MKSKPRFQLGYFKPLAVLVIGTALTPWMSAAAQSIPTFSADVAPILFEKCASCHNPEGIGPMPLLSYAEVKPWAGLISYKVQAREMPPWHLDKTTGIQNYQNDVSLSDEQITTIVSWVESGVPEGDPASMPPQPALPKGNDWQTAELLGPPDFVVKSPPYTVTANAQDQTRGVRSTSAQDARPLQISWPRVK